MIEEKEERYRVGAPIRESWSEVDERMETRAEVALDKNSEKFGDDDDKVI